MLNNVYFGPVLNKTVPFFVSVLREKYFGTPSEEARDTLVEKHCTK